MTTKMNKEGFKRSIIYPDMKLYQEIILLKNYCKKKWVVENVISYYKPLIEPYEVSRHYFWSNFLISKNIQIPNRLEIKGHLRKNKHFDITDKDTNYRKDQILRNCVEPELGLHVFNSAFKYKQTRLIA